MSPYYYMWILKASTSATTVLISYWSVSVLLPCISSYVCCKSIRLMLKAFLKLIIFS